VPSKTAQQNANAPLKFMTLSLSAVRDKSLTKVTNCRNTLGLLSCYDCNVRIPICGGESAAGALF
jgi:hypothetical protein